MEITYQTIHSADKILSLKIEKLLDEINCLRESNGELRMQAAAADPTIEIDDGLTVEMIAKHLVAQDELLTTAEIALRATKNGAY